MSSCMTWRNLVGAAKVEVKVLLSLGLKSAWKMTMSGRWKSSKSVSTTVVPGRAEIWAEIQPLALRYRIEPEFIYGLVAAESNFDARARNEEARGKRELSYPAAPAG